MDLWSNSPASITAKSQALEASKAKEQLPLRLHQRLRHPAFRKRLSTRSNQVNTLDVVSNMFKVVRTPNIPNKGADAVHRPILLRQKQRRFAKSRGP